MSKTTPATLALTRLGIRFELHTYDYDPDGQRVGLQAADALGAEPSQVLKTLIALVDAKPVCLMVPSDREVSMKKVAAVFGGKSARMAPVPDAERITGYKVGGVSPFGQKRKLPTAIEASAMGGGLVFVNAGRRGLQVRLTPEDARDAADAQAAALVVEG